MIPTPPGTSKTYGFDFNGKGVLANFKVGTAVVDDLGTYLLTLQPGPIYTLPIAAANQLGGVKTGANVTIAADGTLSVVAPLINTDGLTEGSGNLYFTNARAIAAAFSESVTFAQLTARIAAATLVPGKQYALSDYQTTHTIDGTSDVNTGPIEPLLLQANGPASLAPLGYSLTNLLDIIYYTPSNADPRLPGITTGLVYRRIDTGNGNDIAADFRALKFRRWLDDTTNVYLTTLDNGAAFKDSYIFDPTAYSHNYHTGNNWGGFDAGSSVLQFINVVSDANSHISGNIISEGSSFSGVTLIAGGMIGNSFSGVSELYNVYIEGSNFICNSFSNRSQLSNNTVTKNSSVYNNALTDGYFRDNVLTNGSLSGNSISQGQISGNTITNAGFIKDNIVNGSNSYIYQNQLTGGSIQDNVIYSSVLNYNVINGGTIAQNVISGGGGFSYNTLGQNSQINTNTLANSSVNNVTLPDNSQLSTNSLVNSLNCISAGTFGSFYVNNVRLDQLAATSVYRAGQGIIISNNTIFNTAIGEHISYGGTQTINIAGAVIPNLQQGGYTPGINYSLEDILYNGSTGTYRSSVFPTISLSAVSNQGVLFGFVIPNYLSFDNLQTGANQITSCTITASTKYPFSITIYTGESITLYCNGATWEVVSRTQANIVTAGAGIAISPTNVISATGGSGTYTLPPATATVLGGVKQGANVTIAADGTLSTAAPLASTDGLTEGTTNLYFTNARANAAVASEPLTYAQLTARISASTLVPGKNYTLTDFQTTYTMPNTAPGVVVPITCPLEPLLLRSSSANSFSAIAYPVNFPQDIVYYSPSNTDPRMPGSTKGLIYRRIDNQFNNDIEADFRVLKFRRYKNATTGLYTTPGYDSAAVFQDLYLFDPTAYAAGNHHDNKWGGFNATGSILFNIGLVSDAGSFIYGNTLTGNSNFTGNTLISANLFYNKLFNSSINNNIINGSSIYSNELDITCSINTINLSASSEISLNTFSGYSQISNMTLNSGFVQLNSFINNSSIYQLILSGSNGLNGNTFNTSSTSVRNYPAGTNKSYYFNNIRIDTLTASQIKALLDPASNVTSSVSAAGLLLTAPAGGTGGGTYTAGSGISIANNVVALQQPTTGVINIGKPTISAYISSTGTVVTGPTDFTFSQRDFSVTDFFPVTAGITYYANYVIRGIGYYDATKTFIATAATDFSGIGYIFTPPANTAFTRLVTDTYLYPLLQVTVFGALPYAKTIDGSAADSTGNITSYNSLKTLQGLGDTVRAAYKYSIPNQPFYFIEYQVFNSLYVVGFDSENLTFLTITDNLSGTVLFTGDPRGVLPTGFALVRGKKYTLKGTTDPANPTYACMLRFTPGAPPAAGSAYTAGTGISVVNNVISSTTDLSVYEKFTGYYGHTLDFFLSGSPSTPVSFSGGVFPSKLLFVPGDRVRFQSGLNVFFAKVNSYNSATGDANITFETTFSSVEGAYTISLAPPAAAAGGTGATYTAGTGITVVNNVISNSAPGTAYTAGSGITISVANVIAATGTGGSGGGTFRGLWQASTAYAQYDIVTNPSNVRVFAPLAFTSTGTYVSSNWSLLVPYASATTVGSISAGVGLATTPTGLVYARTIDFSNPQYVGAAAGSINWGARPIVIISTASSITLPAADIPYPAGYDPAVGRIFCLMARVDCVINCGTLQDGSTQQFVEGISTLPLKAKDSVWLRYNDTANGFDIVLDLRKGGSSAPYTAGTGIAIANNVITNSSPGKTYTGGAGISVVNNVISNTATTTGGVFHGNWSPNTYYYQYDSVIAPSGSIVYAPSAFASGTTYSPTNWALELPPATTILLGGVKQGANVTIASDGTISVLPPGGAGTAYTAGTGISIANNVISATGTGGGAVYTAGTGISIANNAISATLYGATGQNADGSMTQQATTNALSLLAPLNSPQFTGSPNLPLNAVGVTQSPGNSTNSLATTQFVQNLTSNYVTSTTFDYYRKTQFIEGPNVSAYTVLASDLGNILSFNQGTIVTIPSSGSPAGIELTKSTNGNFLDVLQNGFSVITIVGAPGVFIDFTRGSAPRTSGQWSSVRIIRYATDYWFVVTNNFTHTLNFQFLAGGTDQTTLLITTDTAGVYQFQTSSPNISGNFFYVNGSTTATLAPFTLAPDDTIRCVVGRSNPARGGSIILTT